MLTRFYYIEELLLVFNSSDNYKIGEFIDIEENSNNVLYNGNTIPKFKTYVVYRIVKAIEKEKVNYGGFGQPAHIKDPTASLNIYLKNEREYKINLLG